MQLSEIQKILLSMFSPARIMYTDIEHIDLNIVYEDGIMV